MHCCQGRRKRETSSEVDLVKYEVKTENVKGKIEQRVRNNNKSNVAPYTQGELVTVGERLIPLKRNTTFDCPNKQPVMRHNLGMVESGKINTCKQYRHKKTM